MFKRLKNRIKRFIIDTVAEDIERDGVITNTISKNIARHGKIYQSLKNAEFAKDQARWLHQGR